MHRATTPVADEQRRLGIRKSMPPPAVDRAQAALRRRDAPPRSVLAASAATRHAPRIGVRMLLVAEDDGLARRIGDVLAESTTAVFSLERALDDGTTLPGVDGHRFQVALVVAGVGDGIARVERWTQAVPELPVVFLLREPDEAETMAAIEHGAAAVLSLPELSPTTLTRSIRQAIEHHRTVVELRFSRQRERHMATHDALTGLPNRVLLMDRLAQSIAFAERYHQSLAVLFIDLDGFKQVNDGFGHAIGDEMLVAVARRLSARLRQSDTVARLGGDEFVALLVNLRQAEDAARVAEQLVEELARPYLLGPHELRTSPSIGVALYPTDGEKAESLLMSADAAMYQAKAAGRATYRVFAPGMCAVHMVRQSKDRELQQSVAAGQLVLHYQPQIDIRDGAVRGVEALARWPAADGAIRPPEDFIPFAEDTGLIFELGEWVLHTACTTARSWLDGGLPPLRMAVNITPRQLRRDDFTDVVRRILMDVRLPPQRLALEIAESSIVGHREILESLTELRSLGVRVILDEFGAGYSSLESLRRVPTDGLKIDRSLIRDLGDPATATITTALIAMARSMKLDVTAVGVETREQIEFLRRHRCHYVQGFLYARPLTAAAIREQLDEGGGWPQPEQVRGSVATWPTTDRPTTTAPPPAASGASSID